MTLLDLFSVEYVERNADKSNYRVSGVGKEGNIVFCPDWAATLDKSYLRYSAITIGKEDAIGESLIERTIEKPAVIVARTGASFCVLKDEWKLIAETDLIVLQCKQDVSNDHFFFLIAWLKSNLCIWDLLYNKRSNSMYYFKQSFKPSIPCFERENFEKLCMLSRSIILDEDTFVARFNESLTEKEYDLEIDNFNNIIIPNKLKKIERLFLNHYSIGVEEKKIIDQELELNGYYVY